MEIKDDEIRNFWPEEGGFQAMGKEQLYAAKTVIIASGTPQKASIPGEEKLGGERGQLLCHLRRYVFPWEKGFFPFRTGRGGEGRQLPGRYLPTGLLSAPLPRGLPEFGPAD